MCFVEPGQNVSRSWDRYGGREGFGCRQMQSCGNDDPEGGQSDKDEWSSNHPDSKQQPGALLKPKILEPGLDECGWTEAALPPTAVELQDEERMVGCEQS